MIVTEIQGNIHQDPPPAGTHMEVVRLPEDQMVKRILRLQTDHNREVGIRLPSDAPDLADGDILAREEGNIVVLRVEPTDVIVISPRDILEMGFVAHSLGNRHLQAQFFDSNSEYQANVMVVLYDHTVIQFLDAVAIPYDRQDRVMPKAFRHSEHTH